MTRYDIFLVFTQRRLLIFILLMMKSRIQECTYTLALYSVENKILIFVI